MELVFARFTNMQTSMAMNQELAARRTLDQSETDKKKGNERQKALRRGDRSQAFTMSRKTTRMSAYKP